MTTNFQQTSQNFIFLTMFVLSILAFIIQVQSDNNASTPIVQDALFNNTFQNLKQNATGSQNQANNQSILFFGEKPTPGFGSIVLLTIVSVGKTFSTLIFGIFGIIFEFPLIVLGIPISISSLLFSFLLIMIITAVWLLYKLGG